MNERTKEIDHLGLSIEEAINKIKIKELNKIGKESRV